MEGDGLKTASCSVSRAAVAVTTTHGYCLQTDTTFIMCLYR